MRRNRGKRWFYSLGARSMQPDYNGPFPMPDWPQWAILEFFRGQDDARFSRAIGIARTLAHSETCTGGLRC